MSSGSNDLIECLLQKNSKLQERIRELQSRLIQISTENAGLKAKLQITEETLETEKRQRVEDVEGP